MNDDKQQILAIIDEITYLLELKGENVFKISAFKKAYSIISGVQEDLSQLFESGQLAQMKGIGKGILSVIADHFNLGYSTALREIKTEVPEGLIEINKIRGLGPKKAIQLYFEFGITNISKLESFCTSGEITKVKGFTEASAEKLIESIRLYKQNQNFIRLDVAGVLVDEILGIFADFPEVEEYSVTGEYRRNMEVISTLEFVIMTLEPESVLRELRILLDVPDLEYSKASSFADKINIIVHCESNNNDYCLTLYRTTGSKDFIQKYNLAEINTKGLYSEHDVFKRLTLPYFNPEMREQELLPFVNDERFLNSDLKLSDFKGCFHFHTNFSDGANTLSEMVFAGLAMGYQYFAVCDHSKASFQASGMWEDKVFKQKEVISAVAIEHKTTVFHGIEADILRDGTLDYGDEFLKNFDFVVASIHSRFSLNKEEMTARIIRAVENPHTDVLGHPSGRILLERPEFEADFDKIIDACCANDVAIEINASTYRLDLDWRRIFTARDKNCRFSINPDAHSTTQLGSVRYGIKVARKAGMKSSEVINCYDLESFRTFLGRK
jgi:DNA polymerase (family 10)